MDLNVKDCNRLTIDREVPTLYAKQNAYYGRASKVQKQRHTFKHLPRTPRIWYTTCTAIPGSSECDLHIQLLVQFLEWSIEKFDWADKLYMNIVLMNQKNLQHHVGIMYSCQNKPREEKLLMFFILQFSNHS
jgi:hypothetical protein